MDWFDPDEIKPIGDDETGHFLADVVCGKIFKDDVDPSILVCFMFNDEVVVAYTDIPVIISAWAKIPKRK